MTEEAVSTDDDEAEPAAAPTSIVAQLSSDGQQELGSLADVPLSLEIRLGEVSVPLAEVLKLQTNSVLTLDKGLNDPVTVRASGKVIAYGEIVAVGDQLGVRILQVADSGDSLTEAAHG